MRKYFFLAALFLSVASFGQNDGRWKLAWEDNFDGDLDTTVWSRCDRGRSDWNNTMSKDERLVYMRNGCVVLKGMVNDDRQKDPVEFITGGIWTKDHHAFPATGRFEVRARLHSARGAWPAIWMMPFEEKKYHWPDGGEIDIMERLNGDSIAYQTLHSVYTYVLKREDPPHGGTGPIDPDDFNVYGVDIAEDSIQLHINGVPTLTYHRLPAEQKDGQYPFCVPHYMLLDMQLGGKWVGEVKKEDLPVEMEIDWVRYYEDMKK